MLSALDSHDFLVRKEELNNLPTTMAPVAWKILQTSPNLCIDQMGGWPVDMLEGGGGTLEILQWIAMASFRELDDVPML